MAAVHRTAPEVAFRLVLPRESAPAWRGRQGVEVLTGLDDIALRRVYQEAMLLFQPLSDCTANNAVLEALACGLPVVATDVGGIRDYLGEDCACLVPPRDPRAMVDAILALRADYAARTRMCRAARKRAEVFAWPHVVRQMLAVYKSLA